MTKKLFLADYIKSLYTVDGNNYLYLHDGQGSYTNASQEAEDNSYRYAGASDEVNNYVCFGSDTEICSEDNLYRIIEVFDNKTKLIKADYDDQNLMGTDGKYKNYTYYDAWVNLTDTYYKGVKDITKLNLYVTGSSYWSDSQLNTINLNYNFLNTFTEDWKNKISSENWIIGGNSIDNIIQFSIKNVYLNEIVNPTENVVYNTKIGLIYISDYGYAASPENWTTILSNYNNDTNRNNNWMYMGLREWSITRCAVQMTSTGFVLEEAGNIGNNNIDDITFRASSLVRPVFYLNSDVEYVSGTGTQSDPIRIN